MNDHDPNEDVLSIDPASVTGPRSRASAPSSITDDGQRLAVRVAPGATGTATFSYAVTDGTAEGGLLSEPTTVTLTVAPDAADSAPEWCGVERCLVEWPEPEVARGGTVTVPVLPGWVDPEGDPLLLLGVENTVRRSAASRRRPAATSSTSTATTASGGEQLVELIVTIADTTGQVVAEAARRARVAAAAAARCSRSRWSTRSAAASRWMSRRT